MNSECNGTGYKMHTFYKFETLVRRVTFYMTSLTAVVSGVTHDLADSQGVCF